jgi:hypothetical protein
MGTKTEKVYISRDEDDKTMWVWRKPKSGNWSPNKLKDCEIVVFYRDDMENADCYLSSDFKKKFGMSINKKTKKCVHLPYNLLHNEDYKLISSDPKRKQ